jgi:hypothetical protein
VKKLLLLAAAGVGYVLGTRAGRERYEQIKGTVDKVKNDPRVQEKAHRAVDTARHQAPVVADKVAGAAGAAASKVTGSGSGSGSDATDRLNPDSTARQDQPYPQGDLP